MMKINMFVVTHKEFNVVLDDIYTPLYVGADVTNKKLNYMKDNVGENISYKNKNYCELTGLYWIWKNIKCDYVGICHYRRYFFSNNYSKNPKKILNEGKIKKMLENYDIILPRKLYLLKYTIERQYSLLHNKNDMDKVEAIINKLFPEYISSFREVMRRKYLYPYNMMIISKEQYDEYCKWLFTILFELEKEMDLSQYDEYNQRVFGFLSERLLNVWVLYNNYRIKEVPVNNIESNSFKDCLLNNLRKVLSKKYMKHGAE